MALPFYIRVNKTIKKLPFYLRDISNIDINVDDQVDKNSLGYSRKQTNEEYADYDEDTRGHGLLGMHKRYARITTPFFVDNWQQRVEKFHNLASFPEVEYVLHQITNEAITFDDENMFCKLKLSSEFDDEMQKSLQQSFKKIYRLWGFEDGTTAWEKFLEWLIEGFSSYEIIYDNKDDPKEVVGFLEYEASTLVPSKRKDEKNGEEAKVWLQKPMEANTTNPMNNLTLADKVIPDESIIMIAFNRTAGNWGKLSYVERLERSFNMMRIMEDTKAGWVIMNSQYRMKMVIPVGTRSTSQAKQALAKVANKYREDLYIDSDTGEYSVNGEARLNFNKPFIFPSRQGQEPDIDGIKYEGPDMTSTDINEFFERKFYRDTGLPFSRFDRESGAGSNLLFEAGGIPYDELSYFRMINRLRREFSMMILKPVYMEALLKHPQLKEDVSFKSKIGLEYESDHLLEQAKRQEVENRSLDHIQELSGMERRDGTPVFALKFLFQEYWHWDEEKMAENEKMLKEELGEVEEEGMFGDGRGTQNSLNGNGQFRARKHKPTRSVNKA